MEKSVRLSDRIWQLLKEHRERTGQSMKYAIERGVEMYLDIKNNTAIKKRREVEEKWTTTKETW